MSDHRPPRVVAELGRPETPEETAARRAENSRLHRVRQNTRNLVASLAVTVGIVLVVVLIAPRGTGTAGTKAVDYAAAARTAQRTAGQPLLAPAVPAGWRSNAAELRDSTSVTSWYVGFVTGAGDYVAFNEGLGANAAWLDDLLQQAPRGGTTTISGLPWRVYDQRSRGQAAGNVAYALVTRVGSTWLAVYGTAPASDEATLAGSLATAAQQAGIGGTAVAP